MTRKSRRELERVLEEIENARDRDSMSDLSDFERGVTAPFVTYEGERDSDGPGAEFEVVDEEDIDDSKE